MASPMKQSTDGDNGDSVLQLPNPRQNIFQVGASAGRLCSVLYDYHPDDQNNNNTQSHHLVVRAMEDLIFVLFQTSQALQLHLPTCIRAKLALNCKKYPVALCKGKAGKYTEYSQVTGVTVDNQSTQEALTALNTSTSSSSSSSSTSPSGDESSAGVEDAYVISWEDWRTVHTPALVREIQEFAQERDWTQFHTPRNIGLALLGEVGELAELVQWKGDAPILDMPLKQVDKLSQELADVAIYLYRMVSVTDSLPDLMEQMQIRNE